MAARRSAVPTLADVAAGAGVSQATASRALADSPLVNADTRGACGRSPSGCASSPTRLARSLRSGATMAVGLVVPDVGAAFYAIALKSAQDVLEAAATTCSCSTRAAPPSASARRCGRCARTRSTGCWSRPRAATRRSACPRCSSTTSRSGRAPARSRWTTRPGIRLLVDHLVGVHGHERIAYLGPPESLGTGAVECCRAPAASGSRRSAPRWAAPACRCRPSTCARASRRSSEDDGRAGRARADGARAAPDRARSAGTDQLAIGLLRGLRDAGLRVPEDVALVSFDEPVRGRPARPAVTSLDRHDAQLGRLAAAALLRDAARRGGRDAGSLRVPPRSTSAARADAGAGMAPRKSSRWRYRLELTLVVKSLTDARRRCNPLQRLQSIASNVRRAEESGGAGDRDRRDRHGLDGARAQRPRTAACSSTSPTSGSGRGCVVAAT